MPRLSFLPFIFIACLSASAEEVLHLDHLEVAAPRAVSLTTPLLAQARAELALTPGGVEVISAERYLRGRASTVEDTFALSPGILALPRFGSDEARLSIRGSGLQRTFHGRGLRLLQDGVPLNLADGSFDMQALEPLAAHYITLWRGGNALTAGAATLGGAIDYISHTGRTAPGGFSRLEAGSWDYLRISMAGGGQRGDVDGYACFTHQAQTGFRAHARQQNERLFANGGAQLSRHAETRFYLAAVASESELPGNLTKAQLQLMPRQANPANVTLHQQRNFTFFRLAHKTSVHTGATRWDLISGWTRKDLDHPISQVVDQLSNDTLLGLTATQRGDFAGHEHRLRAGVLFNRGTIEATQFVNLAGHRGDLLSDADQTATNVEAFAEEQLALNSRLTLVFGFSAARHQRENTQLIGGPPSYHFEYERFMPKLGLRWDRAGVTWYANLSDSYEPPSFSEALTANAPRHAQTATTIELGTRGSRQAVRWEVTFYHATLKHELLSLDHDHIPTTPAVTINADRTLHRGIEVATEIDLLGTSWDEQSRPAHRLALRTAWTYGRFTFEQDPRYGDNTLAGLPPHLIRSELMWESASGWYAGPIFAWSPRPTWIDFRNTFAADAWTNLGVRIGQRHTTGLSWFIEGRNLADRVYAVTTGVIESANGRDQAQFLPGDGRGLFAGVEWRW